MKATFLPIVFAYLLNQPIHAVDKAFYQKEVLGKDWPRDLLTYDVQFKKGEAKPADMELVDGEESSVPFQFSGVSLHGDGSIQSGKVSFYAELAAGGEMNYVLRNATGKAKAGTESPASAKTGGGQIILENTFTAVRIPSLGGFQGTKALSELPGPIGSFRLSNRKWIGGSQFLADNAPESLAVKDVQSKILASGPLYSEAAIRYEFEGGGYFEVQIRLEAGQPLVWITEESDTGLIGSPNVSVDYRLGSPGWKPDILYRRAGRGLPGSDEGLEEKMAGLGIAIPKARGGAQNFTKVQPVESESVAFGLNIASRWSTGTIFAGLFREADLKNPQRPFVGILPMHVGQWRNAHHEDGFNVRVVQHPQGGLSLRAPLVAPNRRDSYLHTGEHDNQLPETLLRRNWALVVGPAPESMESLWNTRIDEGYLTLDDYKDWILDWPEDKSITYPRLFYTAKDLETARKHQDTNPYKEQLLGLPYFQDDPKLREQLFTKAVKGSKLPRGYANHLLYRGGYMGLPWISGFHQANYAIRWTLPAEDALAMGGLDDAQRQELRASLAALAYAASAPDVSRRVCGVHQGNPNMPIRRFLALPFMAALIPDHPRAKDWLGMSAQFLEFKLQTMVGPKGDWGEPGRYLNASLPYFIQAAIILENAGYLSEKAARQCAAVAHAHSAFLSPPDPRFEGKRIVESIGHGSQIDYYYAFANAVLMRNVAPEEAKEMVWAWDAMGRPGENETKTNKEGYDIYPRLLPIFGHMLKDLKDASKAKARGERVLQSSWHPGWGAVMRAHAGDPNETFMVYRQGYLVSHADPNQGDFIIHAKGTPLTPSSKAHYLLHSTDRGDWGGPEGLYATAGDHFCRVRFGRPDLYGGQPGGGTESNINEYFAGEAVDYVRGWGHYAHVNKWAVPKSQWLPDDPSVAVNWDRQILFLKGKTADGPNYFVFRDTFTGQTKQPKYWHLRTAVEPKKIRKFAMGFEVEAGNGTKLNATFLTPGKLKTKIVSGRDLDIVCSVAQVELCKEAKEALVVVYPRLPNEEVPKYEHLSKGVLKAQTSEGTDYVFLGGNDSLTCAMEGVSFIGRSGAIRVGKREIRFILTTADGPGSLSYHGTTYTGPAPFEIVVPRNKLKQGSFPTAQPTYSINSYHPNLQQRGDQIHFEGASGGVEKLDSGAVRLVLGPGRGKVGFGNFKVWGEGPFDLTLDEKGVHGITEGRERMIYMDRPQFSGIPALWIDGVGSALGYSGDLAVPVLAGRREMSVRAAVAADQFK